MRVTVEELEEAPRWPEAACRRRRGRGLDETRAGVVPIDDGDREGVATVDEHEVERRWLKSR